MLSWAWKSVPRFALFAQSILSQYSEFLWHISILYIAGVVNGLDCISCSWDAMNATVDNDCLGAPYKTEVESCPTNAGRDKAYYCMVLFVIFLLTWSEFSVWALVIYHCPSSSIATRLRPLSCVIIQSTLFKAPLIWTAKPIGTKFHV